MEGIAHRRQAGRTGGGAHRQRAQGVKEAHTHIQSAWLVATGSRSGGAQGRLTDLNLGQTQLRRPAMPCLSAPGDLDGLAHSRSQVICCGLLLIIIVLYC